MVSKYTSSNTESLDKKKNIKVIQINLNKSNSAMQEMTINLRKEVDFICMVTEPSVIRHRLSGIPRHYNSIPATKDIAQELQSSQAHQFLFKKLAISVTGT